MTMRENHISTIIEFIFLSKSYLPYELPLILIFVLFSSASLPLIASLGVNTPIPFSSNMDRTSGIKPLSFSPIIQLVPSRPLLCEKIRF